MRASGTERTKKSVLLVGNFLSSSLGTYFVCEDLARQLKSLNWHVLTTSPKRRRLYRVVDMVRTVWSKRNEYTVAHVDVYSGLAFIWAEAVCATLSWAGKPYVLTLHGGNLPAFARRWPRRVRRLLCSASAVTTPSRYLLTEIAHYRRDLRLIPNSLDLKVYEFAMRQKPRPRLMWLRAFHNIYNPALALKVLSDLACDFPGIQLTMIGPDYGDGSLQALLTTANNLGVSDRMRLPGRISKTEVPKWLNTSDIFLNTTSADNTPISILEAMACGLCVVSTNVGGIPHLLQHEADALLVPANDPDAMSQAVRRLLTDPCLAKTISHNARRKAEQFDWDVVLPQWEKLLSSVAKESSA